MKVKVSVAQSRPTLATPWTVARLAPLSMGFSRQEYWSGLPFPSPGDLPDPGMKSRSPALQADSLPSELQGKPSCVFCIVSVYKLCFIEIYYRITNVCLFTEVCFSTEGVLCSHMRVF